MSPSASAKPANASAPQRARAGEGAKRALTLLAFFAAGALVLVIEGALAPPPRPKLTVEVPADASPVVIERLIDEAVLIELGIAQGWRLDPLIADRLGRALAEIAPPGVDPLDHAEAIDLHRRDPLCRARLLENGRRSLPEPGTPDAPTLAAWYDAHADAFARPAAIRFEHRFSRDAARAERILLDARRAASGDPERAGEGTPPPDPGEPELTLGPHPIRTRPALEAALGADAAAAIANAPSHTWTHVSSPLGHHIIRVNESQPAARPPLSTVRDAVLAAWREARRPGVQAAALRHLREAMDIDVVAIQPVAGRQAPEDAR